jgi:myo-inositol 2-dehydrogenase / D-chiro-inositol 1-dehydrogenase
MRRAERSVQRRTKLGIETKQIDQFVSVSRDPAPPTKEYMAKSGGLLIDSAIHDFDIARFLAGEVEEVICWGDVRFCEYAAEVGDVDTATLLEFKTGAHVPFATN